MTTRRGYLVALAVLVLGFTTGGLVMWRVYQRVQAMPRVEMPGEQAVNLPAGDLIAFAELAPGEVGELQVSARCAAVDGAGATIDMTTPSTHTTYTFGSRQGASMFELRVATAGPITIRCESDERFVLAFGHGIGRGIVLTVVAVFAGVVAAFGIGLRTWLRRRRERKQAAVTPPA